MQVKFNQRLLGYRVYGPRLKFVSKHLLVGGCIKSLGVTEDVWPVIHRELSDDNVIQLFYHILLLAGSLKELDNYCNMPKNGFTIFGVMQPMDTIAIVYTLSLFDPLKAIGAAFYVGLCGFNIGCQSFLQNFFLILANPNITPIFVQQFVYFDCDFRLDIEVLYKLYS